MNVTFIMDILGEKFPCSLLLAPVKNEHSEIIMFILNFEDMTEGVKKPRNGISAEGMFYCTLSVCLLHLRLVCVSEYQTNI